jgi:hypothetical protein
MALSSPGVEVKVIDESFYTPAEPGTVPLIVVASAENKPNGAGDGIAPGTLKANAGQVYLITSQKDLVDTFGDPVFKTDTNNNPIHAGEQNEYGLQAAYSLLGVSNRAFVVRADLDVNQLDATSEPPAAEPRNGTYWLNTRDTNWGIFEWNDDAATAGGQKFVNKVPLVITDITKIDLNTEGPLGSVGKVGSYAVVAVDATPLTPLLTSTHPMTMWYKNDDGVWEKLGGEDWDNTEKLFVVGPHTQVPQWKRASGDPVIAQTGSVWIKTTEPNLGARWRTSRYNSTTQLFEPIAAPIYADSTAALFGLDKANGGASLAVGQLYVQYLTDIDGGIYFKTFRRKAAAPTIIKTNKITASSLPGGAGPDGQYTFEIVESLKGSASLSDDYIIDFAVPLTPAPTAASIANSIASAINAAGLINVEASIDNQNRIVITHELGGDIYLLDGENAPLQKLGFASLAVEPSSNLYAFPADEYDYVATLWEPLVYVANENAPTSLTADGTLWYSSVVDEVDMLIHDGESWVGYKNELPATDAQGPFVTALAPETQRDGSGLETGDLWISTDDIENFPTIYKYNKDLQRWILVDKSDQSTEDGVLFADARYNVAGENSDLAGSIEELLVSDYLDPDAPDPALYPKGMLLWNLRRSGFNVKEFRQNYIDVNADNIRFGDVSMTDYYPHRWVTVSGNQDDGSGTFGRKAQRKVIVQALQALVNSNQELRDEESRVFNLMACPGYPELIGELITLNYDRGLTAFIVGDTPARLTPDATSLLRWGTNQRGALEDNDIGATSFDEYMAMFYPWGFSSDNFGNNVVVPPSHMMLRTIALSDQVSYPWFAPAGLRRGGITNATAVGYVDSQEGEFRSVALNNGQRDTLYEAKINPLTFLTGSGLVNYGQKTRARAASALDRINVARLVIYLRSQLNKLAKPYIFEPNDKITRDEIKGAVESLLLELVGQRALYDYLVVCDESNNTPNRIDRNELWIDIAIEPVKAVEFIYIPLRLKNTGEIQGL